MFVLLEETDFFKSGDQYFKPYSNAWEDIPVNWVGLSAKHDNNSTYGRFNLPVRRKISDTSEAVEQPLTQVKSSDEATVEHICHCKEGAAWSSHLVNYPKLHWTYCPNCGKLLLT